MAHGDVNPPHINGMQGVRGSNPLSSTTTEAQAGQFADAQAGAELGAGTTRSGRTRRTSSPASLTPTPSPVHDPMRNTLNGPPSIA